jgi:hypothetical protein
MANTEARWRYTALVILAVDFAIHGSGSVDAAIVGQKSEQPSEAQGAWTTSEIELTSSLSVTMQAQAMQSWHVLCVARCVVQPVLAVSWPISTL